MRDRVYLFLIALLVCGCASPPEEPIRIAINMWPGYEFLYLAQEKGFVEEEGARLKILEYSSLGDCRAAFERGQADGMCCTIVELLVARSSTDRDPRIVFVSDYSNGADVILGQPEIQSLANLREKKVGVEVGTLNVFVLARALSGVGMTLGDVELKQHGQEAMAEGFRSGTIEAMVTYPPISTQLMADRDANVLFSSREIPEEVVDILCIDRKIIDNRLDEVAGILRAWDRALAYASANPEDSFQIMAKREGITPEQFASVLEGIEVLSCEDQKGLLKESEKIEKVLEFADSILRETDQISGLSRLATCIDSRPIDKVFAR